LAPGHKVLIKEDNMKHPTFLVFTVVGILAIASGVVAIILMFRELITVLEDQKNTIITCQVYQEFSVNWRMVNEFRLAPGHKMSDEYYSQQARFEVFPETSKISIFCKKTIITQKEN
jgi:hypothetical protein